MACRVLAQEGGRVSPLLYVSVEHGDCCKVPSALFVRTRKWGRTCRSCWFLLAHKERWLLAPARTA